MSDQQTDWGPRLRRAERWLAVSLSCAPDVRASLVLKAAAENNMAEEDLRTVMAGSGVFFEYERDGETKWCYRSDWDIDGIPDQPRFSAYPEQPR